MHNKTGFWLATIALILGAVMLTPSLSQAQEKTQDPQMGQKEQLLQELKVSPGKIKEFLSLEEKFVKKHQEIMAGMRTSLGELQKALSAEKPDEAKVKKLVKVLLSIQDKLYDSFKSQRNQEMALLTPVQQGLYLLSISQRRPEKTGEPAKPKEDAPVEKNEKK